MQQLSLYLRLSNTRVGHKRLSSIVIRALGAQRVLDHRRTPAVKLCHIRYNYIKFQQTYLALNTSTYSSSAMPEKDNYGITVLHDPSEKTTPVGQQYSIPKVTFELVVE